MLKGDLKNTRNKFADVIFKTELMIMQFKCFQSDYSVLKSVLYRKQTEKQGLK